jgi:FixJ family two-component response regulator
MAESQLLNDADVSEREAEVLALVGDHLSNAEIARRLFSSVRTVRATSRRCCASSTWPTDAGARPPGCHAPWRGS